MAVRISCLPCCPSDEVPSVERCQYCRLVSFPEEGLQAPSRAGKKAAGSCRHSLAASVKDNKVVDGCTDCTVQ